jgi:hypothetical protein
VLLKFFDARNFGRTATGLLLIAGPALLVIGSIVSPNTDHKNKLRELAAVAAHKSTYLAGGLIFLVGTSLMIFAGVGLIRMFRGSRGIGLGQVGGGGIVLAGAMGMGWYALGALEYEMVHEKGLNTPALAQFLHKTDHTAVLAPLFILFLIGAVIGLVLLGVAAWRTRVVPVWAAAVIVVAGPLNFVGQNHAGQIIGNAVLLAGLGVLGMWALSMTDEEWEAPRERPALATAQPQAESAAATA